MSAKLIFFNFINANGTQDSPCAINTNQIVYMYSLPNNRTAVIFTNNDLRITNDTIQSFKSGRFSQGLGEFISIGTPDRVDSIPWPSANGEVLVNSNYIVEVTTPIEGVVSTLAQQTSSTLVSSQLAQQTLVVVNVPSSSSIEFLTSKSLNDIAVESKTKESPFSFISLEVTQTGTSAPVVNNIYSNLGLTITQVTGARSAAGTYSFTFPTGFVFNNATIFSNNTTGGVASFFRGYPEQNSNAVTIITTSTGGASADAQLSRTKINILSWPTFSTVSVGSLLFGGLVFHIDRSRKAYVMSTGSTLAAAVWCTPTGTDVTGVGTTNASTGVSFSNLNTLTVSGATSSGDPLTIGAGIFANAVSVIAGGQGDWRVPSEGALNLIYDNLRYSQGDPFNLTAIVPTGTVLWSSNQTSATQARAVTFGASSRTASAANKDTTYASIAVREVQL